ncbi:MAG: hypothetical protein H7X79_05785 [Sporomusaceae bacterium]|nr:hypothetical protein [Sporomusaceae bacterium]
MDRLPKKNLTAKIIALIMAIVLWVYVMNEQNPPVETSMEVALEVRNLSASMIATDIPESVRVKVRGPRSLIIALSNKDIKSYVELKDLASGRNTQKVNAVIPTSLELVEVSPEKITFQLDTVTSREIPVEGRIIGKPAPGLALGQITYSSLTAVVKGPSQILSTVAKVAATIDVSDKAADFALIAPLVPVDENGKQVEGVIVSPGNQSISLAIVPVVHKKIVDVRPNIVGVLAKGVLLNQISINPERIEISGNDKVLEKTDIIFTEPVDITAITKDTTVDVKLQLKEGILSTKNSVTMNISIAKQ